MKKLLFPLACALMVLGTSCDDDPDQPANTYQVKGELPTCIIPEDATKEVTFTSTTIYSFTLYDKTGLWTAGVNNLNVPGFGTVDFTTPEISASGMYNRYLAFNSPFTAKSGETISDFQAMLCTDYYYYNNESSLVSNPLGMLCSVTFNVPGKYSVHAFPRRAYFGGSTTTTYNGADGAEKHYTSNSMTVGIDINLDSRTATLVMYNARFAEEMPMSLSRVELKGLKVEGDREHGYELTGKNIIPLVGEGQGAVEYPMFVFNDIEFHPTNDLMTRAECEFEVAGRYKGEFSGSYNK